MDSIFSPETKNNLINRIEKLQPDLKPQWGKMTTAQMLEHCAIVLDVNAGLIEEEKPPFIVKLMKPIIRKTVFGLKPYPKNSQTSKQFIVNNSVDYEKAKSHLINSLNYFTALENRNTVVNHPSKVFGKLSTEEKGWSQYKHLNHHLEQFGV